MTRRFSRSPSSGSGISSLVSYGGEVMPGLSGLKIRLGEAVDIGPAKPLSLIRTMLGDEPIAAIRLGEKRSTDVEVPHTQKLFPEAAIYKFDE